MAFVDVFEEAAVAAVRRIGPEGPLPVRLAFQSGLKALLQERERGRELLLGLFLQAFDQGGEAWVVAHRLQVVVVLHP